MGRYLDIARRLSEGQSAPPTGQDVLPDWGCEKSEISEKSSEHRRLLAAGWVPRVRDGKTIWTSPRSGFWYDQQMALELLRSEEGPTS